MFIGLNLDSAASLHTKNNIFSLFVMSSLVKLETSGQSYKGSMIVNYDSRVVIWGIFKSGTTLES